MRRRAEKRETHIILRVFAIGIAYAVGIGLLPQSSPTAEAAQNARKGLGRGVDIARIDGEPESTKQPSKKLKAKPKNTKLQPKWFLDNADSAKVQRK